MKKMSLLLITIVTSSFINTIFAGSFGQRYGANSYIYNLPQYVKDHYLTDCVKEDNDEDTKVVIVKQKNGTTITNKQTKKVVTVKNNSKAVRRGSRKFSSPDFSVAKMAIKQMELENQKLKLQKEIQELENKKHEVAVLDHDDNDDVYRPDIV